MLSVLVIEYTLPYMTYLTYLTYLTYMYLTYLPSYLHTYAR